MRMIAEPTSWKSSAVMVKIIGLLADAVQPHRNKFDHILVLDCCHRRLAKQVLEKARRRNLFIFCVPAATTVLLQPLDTCVCQGYKTFLNQGHLRPRERE